MAYQILAAVDPFFPMFWPSHSSDLPPSSSNFTHPFLVQKHLKTRALTLSAQAVGWKNRPAIHRAVLRTSRGCISRQSVRPRDGITREKSRTLRTNIMLYEWQNLFSIVNKPKPLIYLALYHAQHPPPLKHLHEKDDRGQNFSSSKSVLAGAYHDLHISINFTIKVSELTVVVLGAAEFMWFHCF